ncbi:MAG TPA: N-acetylmuramoyl-L-alanine amidase [Bdellovibrionota bacterium]|jgi:N-acetylmuramoyl-L-alanine amidase|nr:N-acetylmuramoyl-L-alanine amidase [Bdellovibrionota bacterium]
MLALLFALGLSSLASANLEPESWVFHFEGQDHKFKRYDIQRGSPRIDLAEISKVFPVVLGVDSKTGRYSFAHKSERRVAMFKLGDTTVSGTYGKITVSQPPMKHDNKILVPIEFGERVVVPLLTGQRPVIPRAPEAGPVDIVIDPGHGGNDWGAYLPQGKYILKEKDVVLILALRLKEALERLGVRTALTRDRDYYLSLPERSQIANAYKPKFFLSLHYNSHAEQKKVRGYELYVLSMDSSESAAVTAIAKEHQTIPETSLSAVEESLGRMRAEANLESSLGWAEPISRQMHKFLPTFGRPLKMGPFYVLYGAEMPAVLLELGFITSPEDMEHFHLFEKQKSLVLTLAKALADKALPPRPQTTTKSGNDSTQPPQ